MCGGLQGGVWRGRDGEVCRMVVEQFNKHRGSKNKIQQSAGEDAL